MHKGQIWIEAWAERIEAGGFTQLVLPFLEIVRAYGFLGSQALLMIRPLLNGIVNATTLERVSALLDNPELVEQLRERLEKTPAKPSERGERGA